MRIWIQAPLALSLFLAAFDAGAQLEQYTPPGGPGEPDQSPQQVLEEEMADARWRLGPIRLAPWIGLRQSTYADNVFAGSEDDEKVSDLTATVGAGLTAYLPLGPKSTWTLQALPQYIWWNQLDERRQLAGRYGAGFFGFYNRLQVTARAGRREEQRVVTSEITQPTVSREDRAELALELRLGGSLWGFVAGAFREVSDQTEVQDPRGADLTQVDRQEWMGRAGLSWVRTDGLRVALGVERTEVEFDPLARRLGNEGISPFLEVGLSGEHLATDLRLMLRSVDPIRGSDFVPYDEPTGDFQITWRPGWRFSFQLYGHRNLIYSFFEDYPYFSEERYGFAIWFPLVDRLRLRLFTEAGNNDYQELRSGVPARLDDATVAGADLTFELTRSLSLLAGFEREELDSNLPGLSREVNNVQFSLSLNPGGRLLWK